MPRTLADYSKTIIYKLCCKDVAITEIYVGSTTNFRDRKRCHKKNCNTETDKEYNRYNYKFIRANGGFENWSMIQLEAYPCETKREAEMRERYWIENLAAKLNSNIPFRTEQEIVEQKKHFYEANKEQFLEKKKLYCEKNREQIREKQKLYREKNREQIREKQKLYCEKNREQKKLYMKQYLEANKEHIREQKKQYYLNKKQQNNTI